MFVNKHEENIGNIKSIVLSHNFCVKVPIKVMTPCSVLQLHFKSGDQIYALIIRKVLFICSF